MKPQIPASGWECIQVDLKPRSIGRTFRILVALIFLHVPSIAQTGSFEWIKRIGDSGDEYGAHIANDSVGNTYVAGSFVGQLIFGTDTLTSNGTSITAAFVVKYDSTGNALWARKAPVTNTAYGITINNIRVSPSGRVFLLGQSSNNVISKEYLAVYRGNGTLIAYADQAIGNTNQDVDFDSVDNSYIGGKNSSGPFIFKLDSSGNTKWSYIFSYPSSSCANVRYVNGQVHIAGQFKYQMTFHDTLGTSPITVNASGGINDWDFFYTVYSKNGKLISATRHSGPSTSVGGPFDVPSDFTSSNTWRIASLDPSLNVRTTAFTSSLVVVDSATFLNLSSCGFQPTLTLKCDRFSKQFVFNDAFFVGLGIGCGIGKVYVLDSTDKIKSSLTAPYAGPSNAIPARDFSFDGKQNLFIVSTFQGTVRYNEKMKKDSLSSSAGSVDLYVGKYHKCPKYSPVISQHRDTVICSLPGFSYQWYYNNDTTLYAAGVQPYYVPKKAGNIIVVIMDGWGCTDTSNILAATLWIPNHVTAINGSIITVTPNPATTSIAISGLHDGNQLRIIDMVGKTVMSGVTHKNQEIISLRSLCSGVYIVQTEYARVRLVKE